MESEKRNRIFNMPNRWLIFLLMNERGTVTRTWQTVQRMLRPTENNKEVEGKFGKGFISAGTMFSISHPDLETLTGTRLSDGVLD